MHISFSMKYYRTDLLVQPKDCNKVKGTGGVIEEEREVTEKTCDEVS